MAQRYEDILSIDQFLGLNESADNLRLSYAADGYNFSVKHGVLQSVGKPRILETANGIEPDYDYTLSQNEYGGLDARKDARMLAVISQRWKDGYSGVIPADTDWLITVLNGKIYARKSVGGLTTGFWRTDWIEVYNGAFQQDLFDYVTYELNYSPPQVLDEEVATSIVNETSKVYAYDADDYAYHLVGHNTDAGGEEYYYYTNNKGEEKRLSFGLDKVRKGYDYPVDALIMTNRKDGMYLVYCPPQGAGNEPVLSAVPIRIQPSGTTQEIKFGCVARYAERIWGSAIDTDPDKMVYSAPYDLFNWEQNNNEPDDGAGDIQQPDWDGDGFTALKSFGNQLVCFKRNSIWAITGSTPSMFYMRKQYGQGTIYEDSIAIHNGNVFFVTDSGIHSYDGISVSPVKYGFLSKTFEKFSRSVGTVLSCMCDGKYYFYLMTYSPIVFNNVFFCYDTQEGTISAYKGVYPFALTAHERSVYYLANRNKKFVLCEFEGKGAAEMYYSTAFQDFGAKNVVKSGFEVYMMPVVEMGDTVEMEVGIETESKKKSKTVVLTYNKVKRIKLNAKGRKFRFWLKAKDQMESWRLAGGIQISYSLDYD